jgi:hypothetical protein
VFRETGLSVPDEAVKTSEKYIGAHKNNIGSRLNISNSIEDFTICISDKPLDKF